MHIEEQISEDLQDGANIEHFYPKQIIWRRKIITLDTFYASQCRGITKTVCIVRGVTSIEIVKNCQLIKCRKFKIEYFVS